MNRYSIVLVVFICMLIQFKPAVGSAQTLQDTTYQRSLNNVSIGFYADLSRYTVFYERLFQMRNHNLISARIGWGENYARESCFFGLLSCTDYSNTFTIINQHLTYNFGKEKAFFEVGLGGAYFFNESRNFYALYPIMGLRIQPLRSPRFNFRVYLQHSDKPEELENINIYSLGVSSGIAF